MVALDDRPGELREVSADQFENVAAISGGDIFTLLMEL